MIPLQANCPVCLFGEKTFSFCFVDRTILTLGITLCMVTLASLGGALVFILNHAKFPVLDLNPSCKPQHVKML